MSVIIRQEIKYENIVFNYTNEPFFEEVKINIFYHKDLGEGNIIWCC